MVYIGLQFYHDEDKLTRALVVLSWESSIIGSRFGCHSKVRNNIFSDTGARTTRNLSRVTSCILTLRSAE